MLQTFIRRVACLVLGFVASVAQAQVPHVLGVWELNLDKSQMPAQLSIASETRRYSLRDDGYLDGQETSFVLVFDRRSE